jgi:hypothetical protein
MGRKVAMLGPDARAGLAALWRSLILRAMVAARVVLPEEERGVSV